MSAQHTAELSRPQKAAALTGQAQGVDLNADLEEKKNDADVSEDRQLLAIGHIARGEGRHEHTHEEIAHDRG